MNWKACCGLLASRDDEDHDYEDVEEPLPKPQVTPQQVRLLPHRFVAKGATVVHLHSHALIELQIID